MIMPSHEELQQQIADSMTIFWRTKVKNAQGKQGGSRSSVLTGKHLDGFIRIIENLLVQNGVPSEWIFTQKKLELPGYFRSNKKWDLLVVNKEERQLLAVLELKSHVGSFGNNFNNRAEEAMGSATDIWTAYRNGAFTLSPQPWLGYFMLVEDAPKSRAIRKRFPEPHFPVLSEFKNTSYIDRYEIMCTKLVRERKYTSACLLASSRDEGLTGQYSEPAKDLMMYQFLEGLIRHTTGL